MLSEALSAQINSPAFRPLTHWACSQRRLMKLQPRRKIALIAKWSIVKWKFCDTGVLFFPQRGGTVPIIPWRSRRRFRAVGAQNLPTVAHSQTGALHAQPASPIVRHAADNGQCGRLLRTFDPLHFHIQVRIHPQIHPSLLPPKHTQLVSLDPFDTLQPPLMRDLLLPSETRNSSPTAAFLSFHIYPLVFLDFWTLAHWHAACVAGVVLRDNQLHLPTFLWHAHAVLKVAWRVVFLFLASILRATCFQTNKSRYSYILMRMRHLKCRFSAGAQTKDCGGAPTARTPFVASLYVISLYSCKLILLFAIFVKKNVIIISFAVWNNN